MSLSQGFPHGSWGASIIVKAVDRRQRRLQEITSCEKCSQGKAYYHFTMIARHWRGWTKRENAHAYESLLRAKVLPMLEDIAGYRGGYLLRNDGDTESEFVVINFFESLEAVKRFAGPDYEVPVFEPEAKQLLLRIEHKATHYQVQKDTTGAPRSHTPPR